MAAIQKQRSSHANSLKVVGKGYLKMKKRQALSKWYKRYCELDGPQLKYYDHYIRGAEDNVVRGLIILEKESVQCQPYDTDPKVLPRRPQDRLR